MNIKAKQKYFKKANINGKHNIITETKSIKIKS